MPVSILYSAEHNLIIIYTVPNRYIYSAEPHISSYTVPNTYLYSAEPHMRILYSAEHIPIQCRTDTYTVPNRT